MRNLGREMHTGLLFLALFSYRTYENPPPPLCRTDLSEGLMPFDLLKASLVNTDLMCKAGLDSSTYMYMFSSYLGYLCHISSDCFARGDLTLPHNISVVSLLHKY